MDVGPILEKEEVMNALEKHAAKKKLTKALRELAGGAVGLAEEAGRIGVPVQLYGKKPWSVGRQVGVGGLLGTLGGGALRPHGLLESKQGAMIRLGLILGGAKGMHANKAYRTRRAVVNARIAGAGGLAALVAANKKGEKK